MDATLTLEIDVAKHIPRTFDLKPQNIYVLHAFNCIVGVYQCYGDALRGMYEEVLVDNTTELQPVWSLFPNQQVWLLETDEEPLYITITETVFDKLTWLG